MNTRRLKNYLTRFKQIVKPKKFKINSYTCNEVKSYDNLTGYLADDKCGTAACGVGWLPVLYPRVFKFNTFLPVFKKNSSGSACDDSMKFFNIHKEQWDFLFASRTEMWYPQFGKGKDGLINRIEYLLANQGALPNTEYKEY